MSIGRIGLEFSISDFPIQRNYDVRINVKEDFNYLRYGSSFGLQNVGVSFLDSDPINVNENIIIKDATSSVAENSPLIFTEDTFDSQTFDLPNAKFTITDVFKTTSEGEDIPLYLRHDLTSYPSISAIEILDGNFDSVNPDLFLFTDEEIVMGTPRKSLYTNLKSEYNSENKSYTVYYIRFKNDTTNAFIIELLNSKPFYQSATFATPATVRSYTVTPQFGQANVTVHFDSKTYSPTPIPGSQRFSVRLDGDNRVKVILPPDIPPTEKWYLRINPGEFFRSTLAGDARYYVPEYEEQLFSPVKPYKLLVEKQARVLSNKMIYVDPKPIANLGIEGFYIDIVIRDRFGKTKRALTNNPTAGVYITPDGIVTEVFYEKDAIQSVAEHNGFIRLSTEIQIDDLVYVTYRYMEDYYTYRGISVNSTINPKVLNSRIVVYAKPEYSDQLSKTIFHLLVDEGDLVLEANEDSGFTTFDSFTTDGSINTIVDTELSSEDYYTGFEIEILSGQNAGRKLKISSYNPTTKVITVAEDFEYIEVIGTKYRINKKLDSYDYLDPVSNVLFQYDGWSSIYRDNPHYYIILADVFAIQTIAPQSISTSDIRIRGGGITEDNIDNALKLQDQVQWYFDIGYWDGQPYPGMGAILVELPRNILKEVGGNFSRSQVQEIVERHMGHASYPVIRFYDQSTRITNIIPANQKISLSWLDVNASSYNIYVGQNPDQMPLYRSVAGIVTELDIENLENDKVYYIMVESVVGGVEQLPSRTAFAIPFDPTTTKPAAMYGETYYSGGTYSRA